MTTWKEYLTESVDLEKHFEVASKLLSMYDHGEKTAKINGNTIEIMNRDKKTIVIISFKGMKYTFSQPNGNKILSGNGQFARAMVDLLEQFFYAQRTAKV